MTEQAGPDPQRGHGAGMRPEEFAASYDTTPPWDIGRPQAAFVALAEAGALSGRVLDVGCGTGEHALLAAGLGLEATGIDIVPAAIAIAQRKARERDLAARFLVHDVLDLGALREQWDLVVDCGLFHVLSDDDRAPFVTGLRTVLPSGGRYLMLCFGDQVPGTLGPRRISREEIRDTFRDGFRVDAIESAAIAATITPLPVPAWLATITRL